MAEVLGVVASGIAVVDAAGNIGSGIIKLRRLWNEVKDVPDTINSLMQQLELLAVVMGEMEMMQQSNTGDATLRPFNSQGMQLSMARCREAMDALEDLVAKLTQHVDSEKRLKRAKAKLKVAFGKDDLNQYHGRLSNAVQLLQLAQSCYQMSINGAILQRLIASPTHLQSRSQVKIMAIGSSAAQSESEPEMRVKKSLTADEIDNADARSSAIFGQKTSLMRSWYSVRRSLGPFASYAWDSNETKDDEIGYIRKDLRFRFELAQWLSGKSWEIQISRAMSGWHHHLKTYNIVPLGSEVIQCTLKGDIDGIKYLFTNNLASIHDRDVNGSSLLYWAVTPQNWWKDDNYQSAYELAIFLHKCGLDFAERTCEKRFTPLKILLLYPTWERYLLSFSTLWQTSKSADDHDGLAMKKSSNRFAVTEFPTFSAFQPVIQPDFYGMPLKERVDTWLLGGQIDARSFRKILRENGSIVRNDAIELADYGINLLSLATRSFVTQQGANWYNEHKWNELMHELVTTIGDICLQQEEHHCYEMTSIFDEIHRNNPLIVYIMGAVANFNASRTPRPKRSFARNLQTTVFKWLQILQECNVDLESYGQHEYGMLFRGNWKRRWLGSPTEAWFWMGFSWGPNPSDWSFHLDRVVERFCGDFWRLIDNPIQQVPGAWIDNDSKVWDYHDLFPDDSKSELEDDSEDDSDHESDDASNDASNDDACDQILS